MTSAPLQGITVLDLTRLLPGPMCTQMLGELGARVIKIEEPTGGDMTRGAAQHLSGLAPMFAMVNRNKRSITLNLKHAEAVAAFKKLVQKADVVIEGFRPGVMDRLGIGYEALRKDRPGLIYCAITGYGQTGPYKDWAGHDINYVGFAGGLVLTGIPGGKAALPGLQFGDIAGGAYIGVMSILAALLVRTTSGKGQFLDVSMTDGAAYGMQYHMGAALAGVNTLYGNDYLNGGWPPYGLYETKDGKYMAVGALEPKFWLKLSTFLTEGDPEDVKPLDLSGEALREYIARRFKTKTRDEWAALLNAAEVCVGPAYEPGEAYNDPHLRARGTMTEVEGIPAVRFPTRFSESELPEGHRPPELGEFTNECLKGIGYSQADIAKFNGEGAW